MFNSKLKKIINELKVEERAHATEIAQLKKTLWEKERIISYLLKRQQLDSGSLEMAQGDALCERHGIRPWKEPFQEGKSIVVDMKSLMEKL